MAKYYYCIEDGRVLSTDDLRAEFEEFQREGAYAGEPFDEYLTNCMTWRNGSLEPISTRISALIRRRNMFARLAETDKANADDYRDDVADIDAEITIMRAYEEG